jgi:hypothetical protein
MIVQLGEYKVTHEHNRLEIEYRDFTLFIQPGFDSDILYSQTQADDNNTAELLSQNMRTYIRYDVDNENGTIRLVDGRGTAHSVAELYAVPQHVIQEIVNICRGFPSIDAHADADVLRIGAEYVDSMQPTHTDNVEDYTIRYNDSHHADGRDFIEIVKDNMMIKLSVPGKNIKHLQQEASICSFIAGNHLLMSQRIPDEADTSALRLWFLTDAGSHDIAELNDVPESVINHINNVVRVNFPPIVPVQVGGRRRKMHRKTIRRSVHGRSHTKRHAKRNQAKRHTKHSHAKRHTKRHTKRHAKRSHTKRHAKRHTKRHHA